MKMNLLSEAIIKYILGLVIFSVLVFVPAGTFSYSRGWLLLAILFLPMLAIGIWLLFKNPGLLKKRLNDSEKEPVQRQVVMMSMAIFLAAFSVAGLGVRFGWYILPMKVSWYAAAAFLAGYAMYWEVIRENEYLSRVVEVQEHQHVIDTGLYGIVRHPMYLSTVILFLMMPLVLGSIYSFAIMLLYLPVIGRRIKNEEAVLEAGLEGYTEYKKKVRYKVIPFVW